MPTIDAPPLNIAPPAAPAPLLLDSLRRRLDLLRWLVPAALLALVAANELFLARWVHVRWGDAASTTLNVLLYGSVGPLLAYFLLTFVDRWLEEREAGSLKLHALYHAQAQVRRSHDLTDDAIQTLFATSIVLDTLPELSPEAAGNFQEARRAVNHAIEQLYATRGEIKG